MHDGTSKEPKTKVGKECSRKTFHHEGHTKSEVVDSNHIELMKLISRKSIYIVQANVDRFPNPRGVCYI